MINVSEASQVVQNRRHPGVATALCLAEVDEGVAFVAYHPGGEVYMKGRFIGPPDYTEDDLWTAPATLRENISDTPTSTAGGGVVILSLHEVGITPAGDSSTWSEVVTMPEDRVYVRHLTHHK